MTTGPHRSALSDALYRWWKQEDISLREAGARHGVSDAAFHYWVSGKTVPMRHLDKFQDTLGIDELEAFRLLRTPPADDLRSADERIPGYVGRLMYRWSDLVTNLRTEPQSLLVFT